MCARCPDAAGTRAIRWRSARSGHPALPDATIARCVVGQPTEVTPADSRRCADPRRTCADRQGHVRRGSLQATIQRPDDLQRRPAARARRAAHVKRGIAARAPAAMSMRSSSADRSDRSAAPQPLQDSAGAGLKIADPIRQSRCERSIQAAGYNRCSRTPHRQASPAWLGMGDNAVGSETWLERQVNKTSRCAGSCRNVWSLSCKHPNKHSKFPKRL